MEDFSVSGDDWLKLGYISGKLHEFARVYNVCVLTAVQLNRPPSKQNADPSELIGLHRIGRSSQIIHHANIGIQIETRKEEYTYSDFIYHIIKNRDGELGRGVLIKNFKTATIKEMKEAQEYEDDQYQSNEISDDDISSYLEEIGWGE